MSRKTTTRQPATAQPTALPTALPAASTLAAVERLLVRYQLSIRRRLPVLLLSLSSGLLLTLSFEPFNVWLAPWIALVPWLVAIITSQRWGWMLFCSWLTGFLFFAINMYWLLACGYPGPIIGVLLMAGAQLALSAYMGLYFLLFAYVVGGLARRIIASSGESAAGGRLPSGLMMTCVAPVAWVGTELLRGYVLSGFAWFLLGHGVYQQITLIQIADLGGAYAVSFLIAAVNGLIADGLLQPLFLPTSKGPRPNYRVSAATLTVLGMVLLTVVYGRFRMHQFDRVRRPGPAIGVIQGFYPINLNNGGPGRVQPRFEDHLRLAKALAYGPNPLDLIAWPETMVDTNLNAEFLELWLARPANPELAKRYAEVVDHLLDFQDRCLEDDSAIRRLVSDSGVAMLVGAHAAVPDPPINPHQPLDVLRLAILMQQDPSGPASTGNPQLLRYNSAFLYQPATTQPDEPPSRAAVVKSRYDKHHLVPFGEFIPFRVSWPTGFAMLRKLTPMALLIPGSSVEPLTLITAGGQQFRVAVPICYEDVVSQATMRLVYAQSAADLPVGVLLVSAVVGLVLAGVSRRRAGRWSRVAALVLVLLAGGVMFSGFRLGSGHKNADVIVNISNDGWFAGTTELKQHWTTAVFRCVETRSPMARSVNCGCSGFIDSLGRRIDMLEPGVTGQLAATVPLDRRVTLYSRIGDWPWLICASAMLAAAGVVFARRGRRNSPTHQ